MTFRKTLVGSATIAALLAAPLAPAFAQTAEGTTNGKPEIKQEMQQTETQNFTDAQLQGFVDAAMAISEIRQDYLPQLQQASDEDAATELQMQAMEEMQTAVEDTENMNLDLYNQIGAAMQADPEVGERVAALVKEAEEANTQGEG
ncbi:DUF4168 domain-containing protein [Sagittula sp. NFXS13]|uniref:DUF4168 domain-containing protein n=1 Tax=Sagittula marina TaxID=943940 RepID=A0A7W6GS92_9RHOB|nr:DUF4168 domain-containing protein [Sagittula marina]MBB3985700.1 hypothetical protein [Sagittula marina]